MTSTESFEEWKKEQARCVRALATSQGTDTYSAFLKALPMILREGAVKFPERTAAAPEIADGIVAVLSDGGVANATEFAAWVRRQARFWIGEVDRLLTLEVWPDRASGAGKDLLNDIVEQVRRGEVETAPYTGERESQEFWRAATQAAPGQPIPKELEPEEPKPEEDDEFDSGDVEPES